MGCTLELISQFLCSQVIGVAVNGLMSERFKSGSKLSNKKDFLRLGNCNHNNRSQSLKRRESCSETESPVEGEGWVLRGEEAKRS